MKKTTVSQQQFNTISWALFSIFISVAAFSWGKAVDWNIGSLGAYQWFPLFGMIAWMVMATHYYLGAVRIMQPDLKRPVHFKQVTGYVVLGALLLHPGILAVAQFQNGEGLPPNSFLSYVGDSMKFAIMLGSVSLLTFLSFEFFERLQRTKTVASHWKYISLAQSLAMVLTWIHALKLGSHVSSGWFYWVWILCGIALIPSMLVVLRNDYKR